jgi:fructosamine-3-kinase
MNLPDSLFEGIHDAPVLKFSAVSGGSINECFQITLADQTQYFLKVNSSKAFPDMFRREAAGLELLKNAGAYTPAVLNIIEDETQQYLLLSWHPPGGETHESLEEAGISLARIHQKKDEQFGLNHDNYMGSIAQMNERYPDFVDFWANCRILPLVEKCRDSMYLSRADTKDMEKMLNKTEEIIPHTAPSLIHGDLWSGNFHPSGGRVYYIDPAVAYSHPEADLAMLHLFGKPSAEFMRAYVTENKPEAGFEQRFNFFNIYPLLVHLFLFGESYYPAVKEKVQRFS